MSTSNLILNIMLNNQFFNYSLNKNKKQKKNKIRHQSFLKELCNILHVNFFMTKFYNNKLCITFYIFFRNFKKYVSIVVVVTKIFFCFFDFGLNKFRYVFFFFL